MTTLKYLSNLISYSSDQYDPEDPKKSGAVIRKSRTVPPQVRKKPFAEAKEPAEVKGLKEIRV